MPQTEMLTINTTNSIFINVGIRRLERLTTASLRNEESNLIYDCSYYQVISLCPFTTMDSQTAFQIYSINHYAIRSFIFVCLSLTVSKCSILPTELHPVKCVNFIETLHKLRRMWDSNPHTAFYTITGGFQDRCLSN